MLSSTKHYRRFLQTSYLEVAHPLGYHAQRSTVLSTAHTHQLIGLAADPKTSCLLYTGVVPAYGEAHRCKGSEVLLVFPCFRFLLNLLLPQKK